MDPDLDAITAQAQAVLDEWGHLDPATATDDDTAGLATAFAHLNELAHAAGKPFSESWRLQICDGHANPDDETRPNEHRCIRLLAYATRAVSWTPTWTPPKRGFYA